MKAKKHIEKIDIHVRDGHATLVNYYEIWRDIPRHERVLCPTLLYKNQDRFMLCVIRDWSRDYWLSGDMVAVENVLYDYLQAQGYQLDDISIHDKNGRLRPIKKHVKQLALGL